MVTIDGSYHFWKFIFENQEFQKRHQDNIILIRQGLRQQILTISARHVVAVINNEVLRRIFLFGTIRYSL